jgi:predicted Fe-Mo cluster-binding NifX family protein
MKIVVTCESDNMSSSIDPRFGRSRYFAIIDTESRKCSFIENPNHSEMSGAGIKTAQMIVDSGAQMIITGRVGPKAKNVLDMAKIDIRTDVSENLEGIINNIDSIMGVHS